MPEKSAPRRQSLRQSYIHTKCGQTTVMPRTPAEDLAKNPQSHRKLFCSKCKTYLSTGEFTWSDGSAISG